ncbi:MAG: proliferating cell nuclear antigen (pcna) [Candidatus Pacearchaeota archaeon]|nr:proliferating cell nuclear antigen (pcna) [Candidatus Pacearchaeota archaeon]
MLLKLDNPKLLTDSISLLSELVLEVKAKVNKRGFEITAIDPANVALVSLKIPSKVFSQFDIERDEEIGINLEDLKQVLRRASSGSSLVIEKQDNTLKLKITEKSKRAFSLALINIEAEEKQIPSLNFTAKVELDSASFEESINDASIVADSCSLSASENLFIIEAKGTLNSAKTEFNSDEVKIFVKESARAKYSLDYLLKFAKASRLSDKVAVNFSNDYPAKFDFISESGIELSFILAPRVEEE